VTEIPFATQLVRRRFGLRALVRGRAEDPPWVRPTLLALLVGSALLYLAALSASGWANAYYSAAVQAATKSWKAFFFGSFDSSNFVTVDKPPASLWVMDVSARLFGVNSWSILVPQALEGVAAVALLYATVRRQFSASAGLIAGAILALTPIAVLMFRFNNPDALLTLLLIASAYALTRSLERGNTWWLTLAGTLVGLGFLTKMLQALIVLPGFALVYLVAAPTPLRRRLLQLLAAGAAIVVSAGWWVAIVALWPAGSRPYIGSSQDNNILNLIFGYNGFGRLTGDEAGSVGGGGPAGGGRWGPTGITRLFGSEMGTQISWLIPASLVTLAALLWLTRRSPRGDRTRAAAIVWGSWLLVTGLVFSYAKGIIHPYYTVVLAPAIGALVGIGAVFLWRRRDRLFNRLTLAAALALTGVWAYVLLGRADWAPWLRYAVLVATFLAAAGVILDSRAARRPVAAAIAATALLAAIAAPFAYSAQTAASPHSGALPTAGPGGRGGFGGPGGRRGPGGPGGFRGGPGAAPGNLPNGGPPGFPGGRGGRPGGGRGALGGLLDTNTPAQPLVALLKADAGRYRWVAAAIGANSAAGVQLATDQPILAIGGFNGSDPTPTLARFQSYVAAGKIHYFLSSGGDGGGGPGAGGNGGGFGRGNSQITSWVAQNFTASTVGGVTVYDLTHRAG
jgi:4-amino-4-deoxy-L-arabinose transferase-like glycosyltransferase